MSISAQDVKKLKDVTNAGLMDCKKALTESNGDFDAALKILKEKGLADAKKRGDRETNEGGVFTGKNDKRVAIAMIGCETDFVGTNELFIKAAEKVIDTGISTGNSDISTYSSILTEVITQTKENIELKKIEILDVKDNQFAATYIHGKNRIGVVALFETDKKDVFTKPAFIEMTNNICLHIAANSPFYLVESEVPEKELADQKEIFAKQVLESGKPANVVENIVKGKLQKYFSEICLMNQKYVKDDKIEVSKYIESVSKEVGSSIKMIKFIRIMIGG